ncbi:ShlB/FhaC/HecB family hemolysin secretion/activation protein [Methylorubrum extorquens]|uniref:ShlB/FhaC/HecB family hemolysin secretion/activation protein n=1 Tax=Methylorubrum extorquens TaxID=408 RepID=A0AAX3WBC9_METEX|nr:ShlB/FhaC/HecB family hemolysin secretion/activation protein [Methylorubrum extorquens]WHQ68593.1 ShlB/FhaC/HecB family hemolysin secretion/activation protein [Methylorubrum extorquens]
MPETRHFPRQAPARRMAAAQAVSFGLLLGVTCAGSALAQVASQVVPPSFRPPQGGGGSGLVFSGEPGLATPAGAERLSVRLSGVTVENAPPAFAAEVRELQARLTGRQLLATEIFAASRDLEAAIIRSGAVLTRVVLPAQTLRNGGRLRLVVVSGYIDRIDFRNVPDPVRERVAALLEPLIGRRDLQIGEIERRLLLAGDTPGTALRSTLAPSTAQGATNLIVEAAYKPVTGFFGGDNTFGRPLGGFSIGGGLDINTAFGLGETLYFRGFGYPGESDARGIGSPFGQYPRLRALAGGFILPLGTDGLTFNFEATSSQTSPRLSSGLQTTSDFERLSFRLRYPWLRSRTANFYSEVALDVTRDELGLVVPAAIAPISLDRLRVVRLSGLGDTRFENGGLLAGSATLSLGIDGLGARSAADATPILPLSRLGANAEFQKLDALLSYTQPLFDPLVVGLYARGQTSFGQPLLRSEQIGFASFQELSTFDAGSIVGDSGFVFRGEVSAPFKVQPEGIPVSAAPYVFGAAGTLFLERPTGLEKAVLHVASLGLGVRLLSQPDPTGTLTTLTLEFGRRFRDDTLPDANRFTVVGSVRF